MSLIHDMPGHLIRRMNQIATSIFQERMHALDLDLTPVQFGALACLRDHPGIDQATLAGLIAHDRVTIGGVIDRLHGKGLVVRTVNDRDRRARQLFLTDAGAALLHQILPEVEALQDDILGGLDAEERRLFVALASKVATIGNERSRAPLRERQAD
ncbi:MAG: MarR family transcriptional regulator [Rhodobacter sp.]|nr:MarR family transcriptional regulator [Rhodobacter sp.]